MPSLEEDVCYATIPGASGYLIGTNGWLLSQLKKGPSKKGERLTGVWKKGSSNSTKRGSNSTFYGYVQTGLQMDNGLVRHVLMHCLVLEAFVGPCPKGMQCRHLDGNRKNNNLSNLCWGTYKENGEDRKVHGTNMNGPIGEAHGNAKISNEDTKTIFMLSNEGWSQSRIARKFNLHQCTVSRILNGVLRKRVEV